MSYFHLGEDGDEVGARPSETGSRASMEPAGSLHPSGFDPARDEDDQVLEAWAFNVALECSRPDEELEIVIGGDVLNLRGLHRILQWAREQ